MITADSMIKRKKNLTDSWFNAQEVKVWCLGVKFCNNALIWITLLIMFCGTSDGCFFVRMLLVANYVCFVTSLCEKLVVLYI